MLKGKDKVEEVRFGLKAVGDFLQSWEGKEDLDMELGFSTTVSKLPRQDAFDYISRLRKYLKNFDDGQEVRIQVIIAESGTFKDELFQAVQQVYKRRDKERQAKLQQQQKPTRIQAPSKEEPCQDKTEPEDSPQAAEQGEGCSSTPPAAPPAGPSLTGNPLKSTAP